MSSFGRNFGHRLQRAKLKRHGILRDDVGRLAELHRGLVFPFGGYDTACTFFVRFSRAREAEPSAARRILAARLERGAADFSFQLNSAVAAAPARSAAAAAERSEVQPSAARQILAARLERGAADFSFQLNSALAAALSRSAGEAAERSELRGRLRRHPIATSRAWASEVHALQLFPGQAADSSATKSIEKKEPR